MEEALKLILILMRSTGNYTHSRINEQKQQNAYKFAMEECIKSTVGAHSIDNLKIKIAWIKEDIINIIKPSFFNQRAIERKYYLMACNQAEQIINSIEKRFVTGGSDSEPRAYKNGGHTYENKSIF